eukprot:scaffold139316_cov31-Tisochrysis_lutea.AAC.2
MLRWGWARMKGSLHNWQADTSRSGTHEGGRSIRERSTSAIDFPSMPLGCIESRGVNPSLFGNATEAPKPTRKVAISIDPPKAAMWRAVLPVSVSCASSANGKSESMGSRRSMGSSGGARGATSSTPPPASMAPIGRSVDSPMPARSCCVRTARSASRCSTVCPSRFLAAGSAPCSSSNGMPFAAWGDWRTQVCNGVLRAKSSTLQPAGRPFQRMSSHRWMRSAMTAGWPRGPQAAWIGVKPWTRSCRRASAPCCVKQRTTFTWPREHAQCSGVSAFGLRTSTWAP